MLIRFATEMVTLDVVMMLMLVIMEMITMVMMWY